MLPYSEALCKFPAHVQQVDMESNGKRVTLDGRVVDYDVGEIDFGSLASLFRSRGLVLNDLHRFIR